MSQVRTLVDILEEDIATLNREDKMRVVWRSLEGLERNDQVAIHEDLYILLTKGTDLASPAIEAAIQAAKDSQPDDEPISCFWGSKPGIQLKTPDTPDLVADFNARQAVIQELEKQDEQGWRFPVILLGLTAALLALVLAAAGAAYLIGFHAGQKAATPKAESPQAYTNRNISALRAEFSITTGYLQERIAKLEATQPKPILTDPR